MVFLIIIFFMNPYTTLAMQKTNDTIWARAMFLPLQPSGLSR